MAALGNRYTLNRSGIKSLTISVLDLLPPQRTSCNMYIDLYLNSWDYTPIVEIEGTKTFLSKNGNMEGLFTGTKILVPATVREEERISLTISFGDEKIKEEIPLFPNQQFYVSDFSTHAWYQAGG